MKVIVAGAGPGSDLLLTEQMKQAAAGADTVLTTEHLADTAASITDRFTIMKIGDMLQYIREHGDRDETVCILASGDTGYYSIASTVRRMLPEKASLEFIPGISSMQYLCAVTQHSYENMRLISLHGREGSIIPYVCYNPSVFALTGGDTKAGDVIKDLADCGLGGVTVYVGERLTMENERIVSGTAAELSGQKFGDLACVIIDNPKAADPYRKLADEDFVRGKAPMTKEAVRDLAAAELAIHPGDVVIDVGAGTGAMTCCLAQKARDSVVYAIEKSPEAAALIRQNMEHLGIYNIRLVCGSAPEDMSGFPAADKVFIGGSSGNLSDIVRQIWNKSPGAEILVTAVTMETQAEAFQLFEKLGADISVRLVSAASAHKLGNYHLMKADNPVWLIKGVQKI